MVYIERFFRVYKTSVEEMVYIVIYWCTKTVCIHGIQSHYTVMMYIKFFTVNLYKMDFIRFTKKFKNKTVFLKFLMYYLLDNWKIKLEENKRRERKRKKKRKKINNNNNNSMIVNMKTVKCSFAKTIS